MKILITTDLYTTNTNGVVTSVRNLVRELEALGHDIRILTFSETRHGRTEGKVSYIGSVSLERVYPNVRMPIRYHGKAVRALIDWKPDVIHSQCEFFSYQFARYIARHTGAPIVHTYHTLYEQYVTYVIPSQRLGEKLVSRMSRSRLKRASVIIAPTRKVEDTLQGYGVHNPIRVIPTGIQLAQHRQRITPEQRSQKRRELGFTDDQIVLLNLGRLGEEKNIGELLKMFELARSGCKRLRFLIVGDGPARQSLEKTADELGIRDQVVFTGMVSPTQVQNYYQLADVFVSASTSETQGLTYAEAAANGLPLLCRQDPCLDGVLIPGENGYPYNNEDEFLAGLHNLMEQDSRQAAGDRSRLIAEEFSCETFGKRVSSLYEEVTCSSHC